MSKPRLLGQMVIAEAQVLRDVKRFAELHPRVAWVGRVNSGGCFDRDDRYVRFNTIPGCPDLIGQMMDGRFLAIEVKRSDWNGPRDDREQRQVSFVEMVRAHGGVAGIVRSLREAEVLLHGG